MVWGFRIASILFILILIALCFLFYQYNRWRRHLPKPPYKRPLLIPTPHQWKNDDITVSWIGHSTLYINFFGTKILTDPVFSERVGLSLGPLTIGPKRHTAPALPLKSACDIDLILLSHAHMDHFDLPSLKRLANRSVQVITAAGTSRLLKRMKFGRIQELGGKDKIELDNGMTITAVPVRHWGNRFPWNHNYAWTGYLIEYKGVRLFFAGDTAYTPTLKELQTIGPIDIAFVPIGAYSPVSFQGAHCTPEQAWQMFLESGAKWLVPIHWDTFVLSHEPVEEPMERLLAVAGEEAGRIVIRKHGEEFRFSYKSSSTYENRPEDLVF
ncbi:MBL fold metallo-hydrolase [Effusibacillus consociatus]|uniref:MBL fold metallo-hydrolase n=1 Tax=Effusibacillus consociatus TaxID=1117041 RepID=A0ABV9PYZ2_9BACL